MAYVALDPSRGRPEWLVSGHAGARQRPPAGPKSVTRPKRSQKVYRSMQCVKADLAGVSAYVESRYRTYVVLQRNSGLRFGLPAHTPPEPGWAVGEPAWPSEPGTA